MPLMKSGRNVQPGKQSKDSVEKFLRNFPAVLSQLLEDLLVQPCVHLRGVALVARIAQFRRKFFSSGEAAVHADQLHQIHD